MDKNRIGLRGHLDMVHARCFPERLHAGKIFAVAGGVGNAADAVSGSGHGCLDFAFAQVEGLPQRWNGAVVLQ
ncbi:hypothetical protein D3C72_1597620 [compost metagenome]